MSIERFIEDYVSGGNDTAEPDIREKSSPVIVESDIVCLRDPCVIYDNGI